MRIRNVTKNWDWTFGQSGTNYVRNAYAVALDIKMSLLEWRNDCFFSLLSGIPWQVRLGNKNQKIALDSDIKETAEAVEGVLNVFNFQSSLDGRSYKCSFGVYQQYSSDVINIDFDSINGVSINGRGNN